MKKTKAIKLEGVSLNAEYVAAMTKEEWLKHGGDRYFKTINKSTASPEQQEAMLTKAYELAQKKVGEPAPEADTQTIASDQGAVNTRTDLNAPAVTTATPKKK